jgi:helicase
MTDAIATERWWSSPNVGLPAGFIHDRRELETHRLRSLLVGVNNKKLLVADIFSYQLPNVWLRTRRAATLLELSALNEQGNNKTPKIWEIVALTYEAIGVVESIKQDYQWLLSALAWQLAESPSIARLLASKLISRDTFKTRDPIEQMALAFSARRFGYLLELTKSVVQAGTALRTEVQQSQDWATALEAGMLLSLGNVMRDVARYVEFKNSEFPDISMIEDFLNLAVIAGDSRRFRIGRLLLECLRRFLFASSRILIENIPTLASASKERIDTYLQRYPELWPSQRDAISQGLLDSAKQYFIVAVPTSSGKTLCGELAIIKELTERPDAVCFYVVPTRALVTEKSRELEDKLDRFKFQVGAATGALQRDDIESSLLADAQVVVCTPEKLDLLIRHDDPSLANASLFIIDETQMVSDADRGLGLEFVVVKLLLLKPNARILLLSAMLPNSEEFGRWLSQEAVVSSIDWRPTRQRFGEIEFRKFATKGSQLEVVLYDASGEFEGVRIPVREYSRQPTSIREKVIQAVEAFRPKGPVLVFCMSKPRCEGIVSEIVKYLRAQGAVYQVPNEVENLRTKIKREINEKFLLHDALAFGIAYHHADLPPRIRIELEGLIADNKVDVVVSTTTLAEGVNLPISTIIVEDWMTRGDARVERVAQPLDISKFRNIAGRAGRADKEVEGLILFLEPNRKPVKLPDETEISAREYFIRATYPNIQSRFLEIIDTYKMPEDELLDRAWKEGDRLWKPEIRRALRQFGVAVLHAMEVLRLDDETITDRVIARSLLAVQAPDKKDKAKTWFRAWVRFYRRVNIDREELRPIAMQVGLPLRAVQRLYAHTISHPSLLSLFQVQNADDLTLSGEQIEVATSTVATIEELDWSPESAPHSDLLAAWLNGASIDELASIYVPFLAEKTRPIDRTCNYSTQQLSSAGAWGMYALARILELILGEDKLAPIAKRLPLFAYFGVNTTPAALLSLIGIERIDAFRLGEAFLSDGNSEASIPLLKSWAQDVGTNQLTLILQGPDGREIDIETFKILGVK